MKQEITSQQDMEQALQGYFDTIMKDQAGRFNGMLNPLFAGCSYESSSMDLSMEIQEWMVNPANILHGGIAASILDFAMGLLSRICSGGSMTPTVSMTVDYIRSVHISKKLIIRAACTKAGGTLSYMTATAWCEDQPEKVVLSASGTYFTGGRH